MATREDENQQIEYTHDLKKGDHVFRWTRILIYPIQVHGIVLSAGLGCVTIVDLGLAANPKIDAKCQRKTLGGDYAGLGGTIDENESSSGQDAMNDGNPNPSPSNPSSGTTEPTLDEMIAPEDRVMLQAMRSYHEQTSEEAAMKDTDEQQRITIHVLTEPKEMAVWKRVDYGEAVPNSPKKWKWWQWGKKDEGPTATVTTDEDGKNAPNDESGNRQDEEPPVDSTERKENSEHETTRDEEIIQEKEDTKPKLPKSDPVNMVLARIRFLLSNPSLLPPHHILFCNSECIAVWCKTGRWSTLQASIFLHSTAAGNLKSAATIAFGVGSTTVTTTVPASGIAGWFGFTTTSTVSLLSLNPWLVPVLAGYGIVAVGTPLIMYQQSKKKWEETTALLTEEFWSWADSDVYVEAIHSWSTVR